MKPNCKSKTLTFPTIVNVIDLMRGTNAKIEHTIRQKGSTPNNCKYIAARANGLAALDRLACQTSIIRF